MFRKSPSPAPNVKVQQGLEERNTEGPRGKHARKLFWLLSKMMLACANIGKALEQRLNGFHRYLEGKVSRNIQDGWWGNKGQQRVKFLIQCFV